MLKFKEFFTLGYNKPSVWQVQDYLDHIGKLLPIREIIKNIEKHFNIKKLKLDRFGRQVLTFEGFSVEDKMSKLVAAAIKKKYKKDSYYAHDMGLKKGKPSFSIPYGKDFKLDIWVQKALSTSADILKYDYSVEDK